MGEKTLDLSSLEAAWEAMLDALTSGDRGRIARVVTEQMMLRLATETEDMNPRRLRQIGLSWRQWRIRWGSRQANTEGGESVTALLGPKMKEHVLTFKKTTLGWKIDQWVPGL